MVFGIIIDKAYFKELITKLQGLSFTAFTTLAAISHKTTPSSEDEATTCELTASQQQLIEATVRGMLAMTNTSCVFNISWGQV